ncbi:MAG: methyltransferase domain-containing protein [Boseongicola sp.]|nr:methyltransferase domain-containing protein [Boseongicola sp.]MDD9976998.1 methyltransferase domain-containing protein [Boseongicola sp.]
MRETSEDGFLDGKLKIRQPKSGYRAGADPVFLAASIPAKSGDTVLELGTGVGTALLCLMHRVPGLEAVGIDIQPDLIDLARLNAEANGAAADFQASDISDLPEHIKQKSFDHVLANPPYFREAHGTPAENPGRETGRREELPLAEWINCGIRRVSPKGTLTLIQRTDRLPDILNEITGRLGDIWVLPLASRRDREPEHVIVQGRKGRRSPFRLLAPVILHDGERHARDQDSYSTVAKSVLRDGKSLPMH